MMHFVCIFQRFRPNKAMDAPDELREERRKKQQGITTTRRGRR